jgi:hypothetical protein
MVDSEKVRKELKHFPQGVNWKTLATKLNVKRTTLYEILNKLEGSEEACHQRGLWFPGARPPEFRPPSERNTDNAVIPLLNVPSSEMNPMIAALVAQHDANFALIDYCIKNKIFHNDDPESKKLLDVWRMTRNQLAVIGLWLKATAHVNGYNSLMDLVVNRARLNNQLDSLRKMLESK